MNASRSVAANINVYLASRPPVRPLSHFRGLSSSNCKRLWHAEERPVRTLIHFRGLNALRWVAASTNLGPIPRPSVRPLSHFRGLSSSYCKRLWHAEERSVRPLSHFRGLNTSRWVAANTDLGPIPGPSVRPPAHFRGLSSSSCKRVWRARLAHFAGQFSPLSHFSQQSGQNCATTCKHFHSRSRS